MSQERQEFPTKPGKEARGLLGWEHIQPTSLDTEPSAWALLALLYRAGISGAGTSFCPALETLC